MTDVERIIRELRPIADKLGEGAEEMWRIAVRQAVIEGVMSCVFALVMVVLVIAATIVTLKWVRRYNTIKQDRGFYSSDGDGWVFAACCSGVVALVAFVAMFYLAWNGVSWLANPKFHALEIVFRTWRG